MATRRANPNLVKLHRSYTITELAACFDVHKNTVRNWQRQGLPPIDNSRPTLFHGGTVRNFLKQRNANRKQPCPPGTIYCLRCRQPRKPALGMVDYVPITPTSGNLRAMCKHCETIMHRHTRKADLPRVMPDCTIHEAPSLPQSRHRPLERRGELKTAMPLHPDTGGPAKNQTCILNFEGPPRLNGQTSPSLNCDFGR